MASPEVVLARAIKKFTDQEMMRVKTLFNRFDLDGDGSVDPQELREGLHRIGVDFKDKEFKNLCEYCDKDGDGEISILELEQALSKASRLTQREKEIFSIPHDEAFEEDARNFEEMKRSWRRESENLITLGRLSKKKVLFPRISTTSRDTASADAFWLSESLSKSPSRSRSRAPRLGVGVTRSQRTVERNSVPLLSPQSSLYERPEHAQSLPNLSRAPPTPSIESLSATVPPHHQASITSADGEYRVDAESVISSDEEEYRRERKNKKKRKQKIPRALRRARKTYTIDAERRKIRKIKNLRLGFDKKRKEKRRKRKKKAKKMGTLMSKRSIPTSPIEIETKSECDTGSLLGSGDLLSDHFDSLRMSSSPKMRATEEDSSTTQRTNLDDQDDSDQDGYYDDEFTSDEDANVSPSTGPKRSEFIATPSFQRKMDIAGSIGSVSESAQSVMEYLEAETVEERVEHIFRMCEDRIQRASKEIDALYKSKQREIELAESEKLMKDTWLRNGKKQKKKKRPSAKRRKKVKAATSAIYGVAGNSASSSVGSRQ